MEKDKVPPQLRAKTDPSEISYKYFHWGPFLFYTKITPKECQMLLREGKKCQKKSNDFTTRLAGHLSEEYTFTEGNHMGAIQATLHKYFEAYAFAYNKWRGGKTQKLSQFKIESLWINYMKANDFNPPHAHSGDLSFIIYPDMPKAIIKENKKYKGTAQGPGGVSWYYGDGVSYEYIDTVAHLPERGDLFIFPASLKHWVFPFKSKVERISISGNVLKDRKAYVVEK